MTPREVEEYRALRATIRERGTVRICLFFRSSSRPGRRRRLLLPRWPPCRWPPCCPCWFSGPASRSLFNLHTGVERVGRYLQVFYGDEERRARSPWSARSRRTAVLTPCGGGSDPLFAACFFLAMILNFVPVLLAVRCASRWSSSCGPPGVPHRPGDRRPPRLRPRNVQSTSNDSRASKGPIPTSTGNVSASWPRRHEITKKNIVVFFVSSCLRGCILIEPRLSLRERDGQQQRAFGAAP